MLFEWHTFRKSTTTTIYLIHRSRSRSVSVPHSLEYRSQGIQNSPENSFCAFSNALVSGYNYFSILEQATTGSRIPENEKPFQVPDS
jgi:hypothetical protein